jgi:hypothetical protein
MPTLLGILSSLPVPKIASYSTYTRNSLATTDVIPTPSGIVAGDLLITLVLRVLSGGYAGTGWTEFTTSADGTHFRALYKIATGSEGSTQAFTSGNNQRLLGASMLRITGGSKTVPIDTYSWSALNSGAQFTASITAGVMTVTAITSGTIHVGDILNGTTTPVNVTITSLGTGTGGVGTYNLSDNTFSQASSGMYSTVTPTNSPSITTTLFNDLLISVSYLYNGLNTSAASSVTFGNSMTKLFDYNGYAGGGGPTLSLGYKILTQKGATGTTSVSPTTGSFEHAALTIGVKTS